MERNNLINVPILSEFSMDSIRFWCSMRYEAREVSFPAIQEVFPPNKILVLYAPSDGGALLRWSFGHSVIQSPPNTKSWVHHWPLVSRFSKCTYICEENVLRKLLNFG